MFLLLLYSFVKAIPQEQEQEQEVATGRLRA